jgi:hypothetical protein
VDRYGPIGRYLESLRREMRANPLLARRVMEEVADHLAEAAAGERNAGMDPIQAEERAVRRMGAAGQVARQFDPYDLPFRALVALWTLATVGMAVWLVSVIAFVLPARDPGHIPMWMGIAAGFFAFSGLSGAYLLRAPRGGWLKWSVMGLACAAIAAGLYGIAAMARIADSGGHFEGYIVLMGIILCGHGLTLLAHAVVTAGIVQRLRIG